MSFPRVNPGGWGLFEVLTSSQMNQLDINVSRAIDGFAGGVYNNSSEIEIQGAFKVSGAFTITGATQFDGIVDFNDSVDFNAGADVDFADTVTFGSSGSALFQGPVTFFDVVLFNTGTEDVSVSATCDWLWSGTLTLDASTSRLNVDADAEIVVKNDGIIRVNPGTGAGGAKILVEGTDASNYGEIRFNQFAALEMNDGSVANIHADWQFAADADVTFNTSAVLFVGVPSFKGGLNVDNDDEVVWYDDGTGSATREKWKGIPLVPRFENGWGPANSWPPGANKYWVEGAEDGKIIMFEAELNAGISRVMEVVARVAGTGHAAGDPTVAAMVLGVSITDHEGTIVWSGTFADPNTGATMDNARDLTVSVDQPITSSGAGVYHLIVSVMAPDSGGVGSTQLRTVRAKYRYSHLDA